MTLPTHLVPVLVEGFFKCRLPNAKAHPRLWVAERRQETRRRTAEDKRVDRRLVHVPRQDYHAAPRFRCPCGSPVIHVTAALREVSERWAGFVPQYTRDDRGQDSTRAVKVANTSIYMSRPVRGEWD